MSTFQEKLDEFYLNYDTATLLKEESEKKEIVSMFKEELGYPETLTSALLKFNKTYLNSVIMRIKVRQNKIENSELKEDILKFNTDLEPILDKLLSDKFIQQYEKVNETTYDVAPTKKDSIKKVEEVKEVEVKEVLQEVVKEIEVEDEVDDEDDEDEIEDDEIEDDELTEEQILQKFVQKCVKKNNGKMLTLVDMYEAYEKFCDDNDYAVSQPSPFKKYMKSSLGKPEGKGDKSIYKGFSLV